MPKLASNSALLLAFALGVLLCCCDTLEAQTSTLDKVSKSIKTDPQKSPQRQLAQRSAPSEQEPSKKAKSSDKKPAPAKKDQQPKANDKPKTAEKKPAPEPISKERRAELMAFVKANHPELQPLLNQLKSKREKQFQSVLHSIDRSLKDLQSLEKKSPSRYKRQLELWGITSRIQLLSAQLAIKKSEKDKNSIRKSIRALLTQQFNLRREQIATNAKTAQNRADKLTEQLKKLDKNRDSEIARKMNEIDETSKRVSAQHQKSVEKKNAAKKPPAKKPPAKKPPAKKPPTTKPPTTKPPTAKPPAEKSKPPVTPKKENKKAKE